MDGGPADLKALDPTDPLFITETVQEVNPDNIQRDIPPMEWDDVERPTPMRPETESKNMQGQERIVSVKENDARGCKSAGQSNEGKYPQHITGFCQSILSTILCWQRGPS